MASSKNDYREIKERALEVCRDFVRSRCSRSDLDCRFAHPPNYVEVRDGRVIVCFDFTKNRCKRTSPPCKYFHPPDHLINEGSSGSGGRRNDDYYNSKPSGGGGGGGGFGSVDSYYSGNYGLTPYLANALGNYKAALDAAMPWMGGADQQRSSFRMGGGSGNGGSFDSRSDKIEVCREFKRSKCNRDECRFAHPPDHIKVGYDNYVTYCMDFVNGRCSRDTCRYFHPPAHLLDRLNRTGSSQGSGKKRPFKSSDGPAADGAPGEGSGDDYGSSAKKAAVDYGYN